MTPQKLFSTVLRSASIIAVVGAMLGGGRAWAAGTTVTVTDSVTPYTSQVNLTLSVQLSSAIVLTLQGKTGAPSTTISGGLDATNAIGSGTVNFGSMNTACQPPDTSGGVCVRLNDNTGARFVATIDATATVSGASNSRVGITAPAASGALNAHYYRVCLTGCDSAGTTSYWTQPLCGGACNDIPAAIGTGDQLTGALASGATIEHQLALEFLDSAVSVPPVTLVVQYSASPN